MADHKSTKKRIRQSAVLTMHNKYYAKTMRNAIKKLQGISEKAEAEAMYPKITSLIDRLAKKNVIHKNKASNLKAKLSAGIAKL